MTFSGFYKKEDEFKYVEEADFLNIFYPRKISHDTALSNRFYNSLLYCKPMITTKDTVQGNYAEKYNVGVAVENCSNLAKEIVAFCNEGGSRYEEGRNYVLKEILQDCDIFKDAVKSFILR